ncbi:putative toxin of predicted polymorphic toxin system [Breznakia blatticola]|uniref:Putative toxin of predicted polymorphic toxin system n=1 Tax=Breznakia blatticola TaxID=1754012 RepID=A0A4R7Z8H5_9FIRM|nr:HNH/ENDO VII family nuclease [Breznakia blatticola]TDW09197.1 putative toxin of predicted polymorphic toxin system [Breznakia blatticola]
MNRSIFSNKQAWENRVNEENTVSINWSNLQKANEYIQKAKTIAKESGYSIQAGDKTSTLESLRKRYQKQTNYSSTRTGIHSLLEDVDNDFCDDIKVKLEDISLIDIMKLKTENISVNQDDIVVIQDPNTYQGYTTKKVRKVEVSYEDIVKGKTIIDLGDDFNQYIKGIDDGIIEADKISEDEYMNAVLGSKFAHDMEADDFISGLSFVLDCIPVVGGIKNIAEACSGTTMTGEKLSDDERVMLGVGGLLSIGIDIATFGSLSGATTAAKVGSFTIKVGIETGQAMVIGLGSQHLIENGCNPLLAFAIMAGATVAGGAAFSKVTAKPSITLDLDTLASKGINNVDELAKHGITSMDDLAKLGVKNSDDLAKLGIKNADDLAKFGVNSLEDLKHIGLGDLASYKSIDDIFDSKKSFMDMMDATEAARYEKYLNSKLTDGLPPNMDMDDYLRYQKALNKLDEISAYNKVNGNAILEIRREADNLLKYGVKNSSDLGKLGITSIDDLTKLGIKNTDDLLSLGVKNIDDLKQVGIKGLDEVNSLDNVFKGSLATDEVLDSIGDRNKNLKLTGEQVDLEWLPEKYKAYEISGNVKVTGVDVNVSRRVYQTDIDPNYIPTNPKAKGLNNKQLMESGRAPYIVDSAGSESAVELHHLTQREPGSMVEISEVVHSDNSATLHGLVENGGSFRNDPNLEKQFNNFRNNYWKWRASNY